MGRGSQPAVLLLVVVVVAACRAVDARQLAAISVYKVCHYVRSTKNYTVYTFATPVGWRGAHIQDMSDCCWPSAYATQVCGASRTCNTTTMSINDSRQVCTCKNGLSGPGCVCQLGYIYNNTQCVTSVIQCTNSPSNLTVGTFSNCSNPTPLRGNCTGRCGTGYIGTLTAQCTASNNWTTDNQCQPATSGLYVADSANQRIQKFDVNGTFVTKWGAYGTGDREFNGPYGVAVDNTGHVYVIELYNNRVQKFTANGAFLTKWGTNGTGAGQFSGPTGIAVDNGGYVYVSDYANNRVQKFIANGTYVTTWGTGGAGNGSFSGPTGIAVDNFGYVFVCDSFNHRVQKFTADGTFVTTWGSFGTSDGFFNSPFGIAVDSGGHVYVSDYANHRVQKFTANGTFVTTWGSFGTSDGFFNSPFGIAVDSGGYVYVAEHVNHRVQKFDGSGTFVTKWGRPPADTDGTGDGQLHEPSGIAFG